MHRNIVLLLLAALLLLSAGRAFSDSRDSHVFYQAALGKSVRQTKVADFLIENNCAHSNSFWICSSAGVTLFVDSQGIVRTTYLYINNREDFSPYRGDLPFGLKFYDNLGAVEYKLKLQGFGNEGLPDEGSSPDNLHYWAIYKQVGMTIVYDAPYPDEDATIYAILVRE